MPAGRAVAVSAPIDGLSRRPRDAGTVDAMAVPARLRSSRDIRAVLGARQARGTATMVVHARRRGDDLPARVAVVAGRRVGGAVHRNRAKRRLRAALQLAELPSGLDLVVTSRPQAVDCPFSHLRRDLAHGLAAAAGTP